MNWLMILMVGAVSAGAAGVKVSELPPASAVTTNDLMVVVAGGETYRATVGQVVGAMPELPLADGTLVVSNLATADAYEDQAIIAFSEIGNGIKAVSRDGQAGKFAQTGWTAPHGDVPVLRVWSGTGTGQPTSPLIKLNDSDPDTQRPLLVAVGSGGQTNLYIGARGEVTASSLAVSNLTAGVSVTTSNLTAQNLTLTLPPAVTNTPINTPALDEHFVADTYYYISNNIYGYPIAQGQNNPLYLTSFDGAQVHFTAYPNDSNMVSVVRSGIDGDGLPSWYSETWSTWFGPFLTGYWNEPPPHFPLNFSEIVFQGVAPATIPVLWSDGTNLCVTFRVGETYTTNKLTMSPYP